MNYKADKTHYRERRRTALIFSAGQVVLMCLGAYSQSFNGQFAAGHSEGSRASRNPVNAVAAAPQPSPPNSNLSGTWSADDGGIYYVRQLGNTIWWAGFSSESPQAVNDFQRGLSFTDVFRGTIEGTTINGTWADVPRGHDSKSGTLTLNIVPFGFPLGNVLTKKNETGGFRGTTWHIMPPKNAPSCDHLNAASPDTRCRFNSVTKNDGHTLYDNLKPFKDNVVVFGTISDPLTLDLSSNAGRSYEDFIRARDSDKDGDITFRLRVDKANLDNQPHFWESFDDWLYWPVTGIQAKLEHFGNIIHPEVVMYGKTQDGLQTLLPGWADQGANSVLFNGVPINADVGSKLVFQSAPVLIRGASLAVGTRVRLTGVLALDCGHSTWTELNPCYEDDAEQDNLEIHPVYSIDVLQNFSLPRPNADLTGVWAATDVGTYYVRQIANTVWWLGLSRDRGLTFARVFQGTIQQRAATGWTIAGDWADIPLGRSLDSGSISLLSDRLADLASPTALNKVNPIGGNGVQRLEKLYDRNRVTCDLEKAKTDLANLQNSLAENRKEIRQLRASYSRAAARQKQLIQLAIREAQATQDELLQRINRAEQVLRECLAGTG
jgi:hypothetical protein